MNYNCSYLFLQQTLGGFYAYATSTLGSFKDTTELNTPTIGRTGPQCKLRLYYELNGQQVDTLNVMVNQNGITTHLWEVSGNRGFHWTPAEVFIGAKKNAIITVQARRGSSFQGGIAVDDLQFIDCQPPLVQQSCRSTQIACRNKYCIDPALQCNYADDCGDSSDENVSVSYELTFLIKIVSLSHVSNSGHKIPQN